MIIATEAAAGRGMSNVGQLSTTTTTEQAAIAHVMRLMKNRGTAALQQQQRQT